LTPILSSAKQAMNKYNFEIEKILKKLDMKKNIASGLASLHSSNNGKL